MENGLKLEVSGITKSFPGVMALREVSLRVEPGEVHCIVGENGAGKSTLMKILSGVYQPDAGEIRLNGRPVQLANTGAALKQGIAIVYQELNYVPSLSIADNIVLGDENTAGLFLRRKKDIGDVRPFLEQIHLELDPSTPMKLLSVAQKQLVMIAKALSHSAKIIILDEPTAMLGEQETEILFEIIGLLQSMGVSVIYISHRLNEIFRIGDRVSVLKDGALVQTMPCAGTTETDLTNKMVGRSFTTIFPEKNTETGEVLLQADHLSGGKIQDVSLTLRAGEILGVAGLVGSGRSELLWSLFGAEPLAEGSVTLKDRALKGLSPTKAVGYGVGLVPEDRRRQGVIGVLSVAENISTICARFFARFGLRSKKKERDAGDAFIDRMQIKTPGPGQLVRNLSGGNQQKVVLAKWLSINPSILLLDEPTQGIDVGVKSEIYQLIADLARQGMGIVLVSSDMLEVINLSNRILVMRDGRVQAELSGDEMTEEIVAGYAMGVRGNEK